MMMSAKEKNNVENAIIVVNYVASLRKQNVTNVMNRSREKQLQMVNLENVSAKKFILMMDKRKNVRDVTIRVQPV